MYLQNITLLNYKHCDVVYGTPLDKFIRDDDQSACYTDINSPAL